ncbi:MAG: hypothetical protein Q7T74_06080 [Candidatus Saccharibacteria bacterium]|nr:hypothetical protein [Candidatus Saccharibacteria bacterium]
MTFTERPYTLSEQGHHIAEESGILEVISGSSWARSSQSISEHYYRYGGNDTAEYKEFEVMRTMYFEALEYAKTDKDREEIKRIFQDFLNLDQLQLSWKIESDSEKTETLFGHVPKILKEIPVEARYDAALLGGLEVAELFDETPDAPEMLTEKYFKNYLSAAAFAGAVLLSDRRPTYFMTENIGEKKIRQITCGGDLNGDFRIYIANHYTGNSLTPFGELVPFSPHHESETLLAYHSVEPDIVLSALHYFENIKLSGKEQGQILKRILDETAKANPVSGPFGDFGDDGLDEEIYKIQDEERWKLDALSPLTGFSLFEYLVIPGNENFLFRTRVEGEEFVIENYYKDGREEPRQLRFNKDQTSEFLAMLINSGGGRTYHGTLQAMIKARLEVLGELN